jgi:hypothetical protein
MPCGEPDPRGVARSLDGPLHRPVRWPISRPLDPRSCSLPCEDPGAEAHEGEFVGFWVDRQGGSGERDSEGVIGVWASSHRSACPRVSLGVSCLASMTLRAVGGWIRSVLIPWHSLPSHHCPSAGSPPCSSLNILPSLGVARAAKAAVWAVRNKYDR